MIAIYSFWYIVAQAEASYIFKVTEKRGRIRQQNGGILNIRSTKTGVSKTDFSNEARCLCLNNYLTCSME